MRPRLSAAYARAEGDASDAARLAVLEAIARYGGDEAREIAKRALGRSRLAGSRPRGGVPPRARPAAGRSRSARASAPARSSSSNPSGCLRPKFSPHAYIETRLGTIEIELNIVDAPFTTHSFIELARAGFFNGVRVHRLIPNFVIQTGDPRGDGEGGPGYTIRDEFNPLPYVRGTVGMALAGKDTGGSQFFITVSPQPHLDGKYTVFGRVVNGFDQLDRLSQWDIIERIKIWDGSDAAVMGMNLALLRALQFFLRVLVLQKKRGATIAPLFRIGRGWLTASCRPFSCRPWLSSLPLSVSPPSRAVVRGAINCTARPLPPGTPTCANSALAPLQASAAVVRAIDSRCLTSRRATKKGAGSRRTLLSYSPVITTAAAIAVGSTRFHRAFVNCRDAFTAVKVPNRWAEPVVPTQDVDYG